MSALKIFLEQIVAVALNLKFPDLYKKLKANQDEIYRFVAAEMQFNRGMLFDQEGAYNGHPKWAPLKFRRGQILSDRGVLRKSIGPMDANGSAPANGTVSIRGDVVTIGTTLFYAAMMNWGTTGLPGGVLRAKNGGALMIPIPGGKSGTMATKTMKKTKVQGPGKGKMNVIFRNSVKIPARHFDEWNDQDQADLEAALVNKISDILSR